jgi:hypothetical protein
MEEEKEVDKVSQEDSAMGATYDLHKITFGGNQVSGLTHHERNPAANLMSSHSNSKEHSLIANPHDEVDDLKFPQGGNPYILEEEPPYQEEDDEEDRTNPIDLPYPSNSDQDNEGSLSQSDRIYQDRLQ